VPAGQVVSNVVKKAMNSTLHASQFGQRHAPAAHIFERGVGVRECKKKVGMIASAVYQAKTAPTEFPLSRFGSRSLARLCWQGLLVSGQTGGFETCSDEDFIFHLEPRFLHQSSQLVEAHVSI
jgi:hypothetical protein